MFEDILGYLVQIRDTFSSHLVFGLGILLVGSYFLGRLAERAGLPSITGFLIAGFVLGPSMSGLIHAGLRGPLGSVTEIALAIIALVIGSEFNVAKIRKVGRAVLLITLVQLMLTFVAVTAALSIAGLALPEAALLGAIATATAPAATVAIVRSLRARGSFVDHLYGIVALDDAGCVLLFSVVLALTGSSFGGEGVALPAMLLHALIEIGASVLIGLAGGSALHLLTRSLSRENEVLVVSLGFVFLVTAISTALDLSPLLASMTAGASLANLSGRNFRIFRNLEQLAPPLYAAFFAVAGTELSITVFRSGHVVILGIVFVLARAAGKYVGVSAGSSMARTDMLIRRYLGLCMLPQAGVAIGLALFLQASPVFAGASAEAAEIARTIVGIVLFSVFFNEIIGPPLSKLAVEKGATLR